MGDGGERWRSRRALRLVGGGLALAATLAAAPASARLCGLKVFLSARGKIVEARRLTDGGLKDSWRRGEQFILCFTAERDGVVSLWDRLASTGDVERLAPNKNYTGPGKRAVPVKGGTETCFGDGKDGYWLVMDPADGRGLGRLWLVFTKDEAAHPGLETYAGADEFSVLYNRFGAGADSASRANGRARAGWGADGGCLYKKSIEVDYRVE